MLIEFSVRNFRSIKEKQTLSLVASRSDALSQNTFALNTPGLSDTRLLKSVLIYGANASGKSNLYRAAEFMRELVVESAAGMKHGQAIPVTPFRLDIESEDSPTECEIHFISDGTRYQYGFSVDKVRVHEEWLVAYPKGRPQHWFERVFNHKTKKYDWQFSQRHFKGDKQSLKEKTRENALFVSVGAQFNHEQLKEVYQWFDIHFRFLDFSNPSSATSTLTTTLSMAEKHEVYHTAVVALLNQADLGISGLEVERKEFAQALESLTGSPDDLRHAFSEFARQLSERYTVNVYGADPRIGAVTQAEPVSIGGAGSDTLTFRCRHSAKDAERVITLSPGEESAGTLKFLSLAGPWLQTLSQGFTVWIDEIGANMHPLLIRNFLEMSHRADEYGAQVVLTTHDTTLFDQSILRRDQFWFTEKERSGATCLYPLTDYKPRDNEALQKGYLAGRYGAIPFLQGGFTFE